MRPVVIRMFVRRKHAYIYSVSRNYNFQSMCKYAMVRYKSHYACFDCRKTFKRRLMWDINRTDKTEVEARCPQCRNLMANMGKDFEAPKMNDIKAWDHTQRLYSAGIAYHSCGCTGPGYIPRTKEALVSYLQEHITGAQEHLNFWRSRTEPANARELDSEKSKSPKFIYGVPAELRTKKGEVKTEDAINFWTGKVRELESKIEKAATATGFPNSG
jgi:DNA-directed RNA polymerase subunit RPC12/RpoP